MESLDFTEKKPIAKVVTLLEAFAFQSFFWRSLILEKRSDFGGQSMTKNLEADQTADEEMKDKFVGGFSLCHFLLL